MADIQTGTDALGILNQTDDGGNNAEFSKFSSGTTYTVKVLGTADLISFYSYGIYKVVNSFVAKNPSDKNKKGNPVDNYTPFDLAWKYHVDQSKEFGDTHSQEAGKYKPKLRFALGLIDLDTGGPIIVDVSKNQAQAIHGSIKKYENKIDKIAFELSKQGQSTSTTVSLTPIIDFEEDLTDKQQENYGRAPEEFDMSLFEDILYEADEAEQLQRLQQAGFDITLIGYSQEDVKQDGDNDEASPLESDVGTEDLPF